MTDQINAFPLHWPHGRPRKLAGQRKHGKFSIGRHNGTYIARIDLSIADALKRLQEELDRIGARNPVVSTNVETRLDGLPRSGQPEPTDPGVALYFNLGGK